MKRKVKNNKGVTLIEMIVCIAISGIFFTMTTVLLGSSLNLFGDSKRSVGTFSDTNLTETLINKFVTEVNSKGVSLILDSANNYIYSTDYMYTLKQENNQLAMNLKNLDDLKQEVDLNSLKLVFIAVNNNLRVEYYDKDKIVRTNTFNIIGGISVC